MNSSILTRDALEEQCFKKKKKRQFRPSVKYVVSERTGTSRERGSWMLITNTEVWPSTLNMEMNDPIWSIQLDAVGLNQVAFIEA